MRIEPNLYLVGSGRMGFDLTDPYDCNIFLFDSDDGYVVFDTGAGLDIDRVLAVCRQDSLDPDRIGHIFLTHAHSDHAGGAAILRERTGAAVYAGEATAKIVNRGDADAVSLPAAWAAGMYPRDYEYRACPVAQIVTEDARMEIGNLTVQVVATPGHSHDHISFLVSQQNRTYLIGGDAIFHGGRIVLQNTYDCSVPLSIASIEKLATVEFQALLAGHMAFSLHNGRRHVDRACEIIARLGCPPALA